MKRKIIIYSVILLLFVTFVGVGAVALVTGQNYNNNNVDFNLENETAYCEITGKVFVGQNAINSNTPYKEYSDSYTEQDYFSSTPKVIDAWSVGPINFVDGEGDSELEVDIIRFVITIKNINDVNDAKDIALGVSLSDVAVHEIVENNNVNNYFYTKITYKIDDGDEIIKFNNGPEETVKTPYVSGHSVVNIANIQEVPENSTLKIVLEYKRNTKTKDINAVNNIKVNISGIAK